MGAFGIDSPKERKRKRYYKSKLKEFAVLNDKWTKEFQKAGFGVYLDRESTQGGTTGGMFLAYNEYENAAWQYADKKAEASLTWYQSIFSGDGLTAIATFVIAVVVAVASYFCPPVAVFGITLFGGATAAMTIVAIATATATFVATSAARYADYKVSGIWALTMFASSATAFLKNRSAAERQSYALTNLMIFGEYAIYANGSVYNAGAAGAGQTFSPTIAYDATKGIRGDLQKEPLDEMITGRVGGDLAGGQNFHSNVMGVDIPLAKFGLNAQKVQEKLVQRYIIYNKLVAAAFSEFGEAAINADERAQATYNAIVGSEKTGFKSKILNAIHANDSLDKLKNYNRNLRGDFDFIHKKTFFKEKPKSVTSWENAIGDKNFLEVMQSDEFSAKQKCQMFVEKLCVIMDIIQTMQESDKSTYGTFDEAGYCPASDWGSVITRYGSSKSNGSSMSAKDNAYRNGGLSYRGWDNDHKYGILRAGVFNIEYYNVKKTYKGNELLEIFKNNIISKLAERAGMYGFYYNANVDRGGVMYDVNKVWRRLGWTYDARAWWAYTQTYYNYQCFAKLGKETCDFLKELDELSQTTMIQNYLFSIEIEVDNTDEEIERQI